MRTPTADRHIPSYIPIPFLEEGEKMNGPEMMHIVAMHKGVWAMWSPPMKKGTVELTIGEVNADTFSLTFVFDTQESRFITMRKIKRAIETVLTQ